MNDSRISPPAIAPALLMPGYNVSATVAGALTGLSERTLARLAEVIFIDNASRDDTLAQVRRLQQGSGTLARKLTVIGNRTNHGLGGSLKVGIRYILERGHGAFIIVHSDQQGDNERIVGGFFQQMDAHPGWDMVVASRFIDPSAIAGYDWLRTLGNRYFNLMTRLLTGVRMSDAGTGIMLLKSRLLHQVPYPNLSSSLYFNPMLNILLYGNPALEIHEVPLHWRDSAVPSTVVPMKYVTELMKILLVARLRRLVGRPPFPDRVDPDWIQAFPHQVWPAAQS
ncbi:MAG: glycosyltransferase family 2 protein [Magnetococcales bacterium]|nr:glycosyltransferase family 2 protein [Magnetococcales bacterium]